MMIDAPLPRMARIAWPNEFDPYVRPMGERLVLTRTLAEAIAELMVEYVVNELTEQNDVDG